MADPENDGVKVKAGKIKERLSARLGEVKQRALNGVKEVSDATGSLLTSINNDEETLSNADNTPQSTAPESKEQKEDKATTTPEKVVKEEPVEKSDFDSNGEVPTVDASTSGSDENKGGDLSEPIDETTQNDSGDLSQDIDTATSEEESTTPSSGSGEEKTDAVDEGAAEPELEEIKELAAELGEGENKGKELAPSNKDGMSDNPTVNETKTEAQKLEEDTKELTASIDFKKKDENETDSSGQPQTKAMHDQKTGQEESQEEEEVDQEQVQFEKNEQEGIRDGKRVGRSTGYGRFIKIIEEQPAQKPKPPVEGEESQQQSETPEKAQPKFEVGEFPDGLTKEAWRDKQIEAAKNKEKTTPCYYDGFIMGYNRGYTEGQAFKQAEAKANAQKEYDAKLQSPDYKMGKELGMLIGASTIQQKENLEYTSPDGKSYNTTVANAKQNAMNGKAPDGQAVSDPEGKLLKEAFMYHFNQAYRVAAAKKNTGPTHAERLADEDFRKGYESGNQLGRGQDPNGDLQKEKESYFTPAAAKKEKEDEAFKKNKAGFIYGFNAAAYQLKAEKEAAAKAERKKKLADPFFKLGYTAGTMRGILLAVFPDGNGHNKTAEELQKEGLDFSVPPQVKTAIEQRAIPSGTTMGGRQEADETKKAEQDAYFAEAFSGGERQGYNKGVKQKAFYKANAYRLNPDYAQFFKTLIPTPIEELDREESLNMGQLVAYAGYKLKQLPKDDEKRATFEQLISKTKATIAANPSEYYQSAYKDSFNDFYRQIYSGSGKFGKEFGKAVAYQKFAGKSPGEQYAFQIGAAIGKEKIKQEKKINGLRGKSGAELSEMRKTLQESTKDALKNARDKVVDEYISEDEDSEKTIAKLHQFLNNGYNDTLYQEMKGVNKKKMGNDEKEINEAVKNRLKNDKHNYDKKVLDLLAQHYKEGAADGYNHAFNFYKELDPESGPDGYPTAYTETDKFEKGREDRKKQLVDLKKEDGSRYFEKEDKKLKSLLKYYESGYNRDEKAINDKTDGLEVKGSTGGEQAYGAMKGTRDGIAYMKGFSYGYMKEKAADPTKIEEPDYKEGLDDSIDMPAYNKGLADSAYKVSYENFAQGMMEGNEEIGELIREAGETQKVGQVSALMEQVEKDADIWSTIAAYDNGTAVHHEEDIIMYLYDGKEEIELVVTISNAEELIKNKENYTEQVIAFRKRSMQNAYRKAEIVAFKKKNGKEPTAKEQEQTNKIADNKLEVYIQRYAEAYKEVRETMFQKADGISMDNWYEAIGFKEGFTRMMGSDEKLPAEMKSLKIENEATFDKMHPYYLKGKEEGTALAIEMKTGLISEEELAQRLDEKEYVDTGYNHAREQGVQSGKYDAIQPNHYELIPEAYEKITFIEGEIPQEVKDLYYESYWKARDNKAGEIEGMKAALSPSETDDYDAASFYIVIDEKDNTSTGEEGKRVIKYTNVFENAFTNAREAARASEDPQALLDGLLEGKQVDGTELGDEVAEDILNREEAVIQKAKENGIADAKSDKQPIEPSTDYREAMGIKTSMIHSTEASMKLEQDYIKEYWIARDTKAAELVGIQMAIDAIDFPKLFTKDLKDKYHIFVDDMKEGDNHHVIKPKAANKTNATPEPSKVNEAGDSTTQNSHTNTDGDSTRDNHNPKDDSTDNEKGGKDNKKSKVFEIVTRAYKNKDLFDKKLGEYTSKVDTVISVSKDGNKTEAEKQKEQEENKKRLEELKENALSNEDTTLDVFESLEKKKQEELDKTIADFGKKAEENAHELAQKAGYYSAIEQMGLKERLEELKEAAENTSESKGMSMLSEEEQVPTRTLTEHHQALLKILSTDKLMFGLDRRLEGGLSDKNVEGYEQLDTLGAVAEAIKNLVNNDTREQFKKLAFPDSSEKESDRGGSMLGPIIEEQPEKEDEAIIQLLNNLIAEHAETYKATFNDSYSSYEMQAMTDLTAMFTFKDVGAVGATDNTVGEGSSDAQSEEAAEEAAQELADILQSENNGQIRDVQLNTLPILDVFAEQEFLIESTQNEVASIRNDVWDLDDQIFRLEDTLLTGDNRLLEIDKAIEDLLAEKPLDKDQKRELKEYRLEKKSLERNSRKDNTNLDKLTAELNREKGYINDVAMDVDTFLKNRLKFRTQNSADATNEILDYLDVFVDRLHLSGQYSYTQTGIKLNGSGALIVEKNAEDVYTGTDVTLRKGAFNFKASGLEYNEDQNRLILSGGSAVIPKLEGAKNANDTANYDFDGLSFDLNQGVFLQLKLQAGKLKAGAIPRSTGMRSATPQRDKLNPSAPQNTEVKTNNDNG